ncbi:MAG: ATP synthase F0 subunit C [Rikenellaceae bacterium]|jgi:F-type H+-transporting ATPase subunit c|nr:ATP synthase F0 subunit C [Rikenellaceae bacterium]
METLGILGATFAAAIAVLGAAFGISKIGKATMEASARQPEISDKLRTTMIIAAALIEGVALFAVAVCFMAL